MQQNYMSGGLKKAFFALLSFLLLMASPQTLKGQLRDNIYLIDETSIKNIEIFEVDGKKVRYRNKHGRELAFNSRQVLMTFNGQGKFLTFPHGPEELEEFFSTEKRASEVDLIITLTEQVIPGYIQTEDAFEISYHDLVADVANTQLSTTEIAAIIYKDGNHKLLTSPSQASGILSSISENVYTARSASWKKPEETGQQKATHLNEGIVEDKHDLPIATEAKEEKISLPLPQESLTAVSENIPPATLEIDHELYSQKALQKTADLETYLSIITNRNSDIMDANNAIELAVRLFINEDAQIEVSHHTGNSRYKVRTYLNRLKMLKYDKITISWTDISYVSKLRKGVDGNYYGIITLQQRFQGFMDNEIVYRDLTEKNIEVIVKAYDKETDGEKQEKWDVFLSNIGVVITDYD